MCFLEDVLKKTQQILLMFLLFRGSNQLRQCARQVGTYYVTAVQSDDRS